MPNGWLRATPVTQAVRRRDHATGVAHRGSRSLGIPGDHRRRARRVLSVSLGTMIKPDTST
jgi:hypothetical protein